jgi:hypothetical protein
MNFVRKFLDRHRGIQHDHFKDALGKASADYDNEEQACQPRTPGTDIVDPYGSQVKPKNVPTWSKPPMTPQEEAIYYGNHVHNESNPMGLHSHVPGGSPGGGHSHGPQNRYGSHHHKSETPLYGITLDGSHTHNGANFPDGQHNHCPENFG